MNLTHPHPRVPTMLVDLIWTIRVTQAIEMKKSMCEVCVYLITYSQADVVRFPTRHSFVGTVLYSFHDTPAKIMHWSCCMVKHPASGGSHFHMTLKLYRNHQWLPSKRFLFERCGISFTFSHSQNYFSAWKYVTKQDKEFVQSLGHADLSNGPHKTTRASFANKTHST